MGDSNLIIIISAEDKLSKIPNISEILRIWLLSTVGTEDTHWKKTPKTLEFYFDFIIFIAMPMIISFAEADHWLEASPSLAVFLLYTFSLLFSYLRLALLESIPPPLPLLLSPPSLSLPPPPLSLSLSLSLFLSLSLSLSL